VTTRTKRVVTNTPRIKAEIYGNAMAAMLRNSVQFISFRLALAENRGERRLQSIEET
jgi:hypothetical protein